MGDCVFCGIVAGTEPAERLYEDEHALAFLSIGPATEGHSLVVPKEHCADLFDIGHERAAGVMRAAVTVAEMLRSSLGAEGMNLVHASRPIAWQTVFHFHMHLVPRYRIDELTPPWPLDLRTDRATLARVAARIRGNR
jgi:histidine triad (HIT) family protein